MTNSKLHTSRARRSSPIVGLLSPLVFSLALVGYPLAAGISQVVGVPNRLSSIGVRFLVIAISLFFLARVFIRLNAFAKNGFYWVCFIALAIAYGYRFSVDVWSGGYIYKDPIVMTGIALGSVLLPMLALSTEDLYPKSRATLLAIYASATLAGFLQLVQGSRIIQTIGDTSGRYGLDTFNAIGVSRLGAVIAILSLFILIGQKSSSSSFKSLCYVVIVFGLGLVLLALGGSRGPLLGFLLSVTALYLSINFSFRKVQSIVFIVVGFVFFVLFLRFAQDSINSTALDRFINVFNFDSASSQSTISRVYMINGGISLFLDYPLFGSTIIEPTSGWYPHNVFVEILMSTGIFGGFFYICLLAMVVRSSWRIIKYRYSMFWLVLLFIQEFILSMTSGAVWAASGSWVLLGAIIMCGSTIERTVIPIYRHGRKV